jgi:hypothetical protein
MREEEELGDIGAWRAPEARRGSTAGLPPPWPITMAAGLSVAIFSKSIVVVVLFFFFFCFLLLAGRCARVRCCCPYVYLEKRVLRALYSH